MKLLMISEEDLSKKIGVGKKIFGQAKAFSALGFETSLLFVSEERLWLWHIGKEKKEIGSIRGNLDILFSFYQKCWEEAKNLKPDAVYIRAPFTEFFYLRFLRKLKKLQVKVVVEYPTFPYDHEYQSKTIFKRAALLVDRFFRSSLQQYVDLTVTYTDRNDILHIPTVKIENGIDLEDVPIRQVEDSNNMVLIGVANLSIWHGYDRVIEGMRIHYQREKNPKKIFFEIIGEGPQLSSLKGLADKYRLGDYVKFHSNITGHALDEIFNRAHIGVGSLGMHRINLTEGAPLKAREYCARGLPFMIAYYDNDFTGKSKHVLNIVPDENPVDMNFMLDFFATSMGKDVPMQMRDFAEKNISWENKLMPVKKALAEIKNRS